MLGFNKKAASFSVLTVQLGCNKKVISYSAGLKKKAASYSKNVLGCNKKAISYNVPLLGPGGHKQVTGFCTRQPAMQDKNRYLVTWYSEQYGTAGLQYKGS